MTVFVSLNEENVITTRCHFIPLFRLTAHKHYKINKINAAIKKDTFFAPSLSFIARLAIYLNNLALLTLSHNTLFKMHLNIHLSDDQNISKIIYMNFKVSNNSLELNDTKTKCFAFSKGIFISLQKVIVSY